MSLKGNLASVNLTEIFQMLSLSGREGTLFIYEGVRKRAICFTRDGVSIRSRERNESSLIGKILVRLGRIDERALQQAVEARRTGERLLGDVFVEMGICEPADVDLALRIQSEEEIQDLFLNRSDAQFEYVDGYFPETEIPYVNLNVNSLLIEIARRTDEWEYIRRRIRGPREIYRFTGVEGSVEADILAECSAQRVDPLIDGSHSVGEIIDFSYVNKFEVCKLLAAYLDAGVVELVPPDAIRQNARLALRMGDTESAIRHYEYLMTTGDFPLDVMSEAAEAHEANRDFPEAAALLRRLAEEMVRAGDYRAALDHLRRVANYPRPEPDALRYLMDLVFENPRAAAEFSANVVEAGKTLVSHYIQQDERGSALALLERLIKTFPDEVAFAISLVNVHYEENKLDQAAAECERLANSFLKRKRPGHAVSLFKKLLVIDPERSDIRERIRKIASGRSRRNVPASLPRIAIALAVTLLLGGVAVVMVKREGLGGGDSARGLDQGILGSLFARAAEEKGMAAEHGRRAQDEYGRLLDELRGDLLGNGEALLNRMRVADQRFSMFEEKAESSLSIAETIRSQTTDTAATSRARAMLDSLKELQDQVDGTRRAWRTEAQKAAERLREEAIQNHRSGRIRDAIARYELARQLSSRPEWKLEVHLDDSIGMLQRDVETFEGKQREVRRYEELGNWTDARRVLLEVHREFRGTDLVADLRLPVQILTVPPGATIHLNGTEFGQKTPTIVRLPLHKETKVELKKKSFKTESRLLGPFGEGTNPAQYQYTWSLLKEATWTRPIREFVEADPVAWNDRVAMSGRNGRWFVFHAPSGKQIAQERADTLDGVAGGLATDGQRLYIPALDGKLFVHDATSTKLLYNVRAPAAIHAQPLVADDRVYVVDFEGNVFALDPVKREFLWTQKTPHGVRAAPVAQGEDLVILSGSGDVTVLRRSTGEIVISFTLKGRFSAAPAAVGTKDLVFASEDGWLFGVARLTGEVIWSKELPGTQITRTPPVKGRAVFVAPRPGELVAFDTRTGDEIYRTDRVGPATQVTVLSTNRIFFANGQVLSAFAPGGDGYGLAWAFQAEGRILAGPVVEGDAVYIADEKGNLYRLEAND